MRLSSRIGSFFSRILLGVLVVLTLAVPTALTAGALWACGRVSVWLAFALEALLCYQLLATRALRVESGEVYQSL